jgi:excinuclease ABC subunit A
MVRRDIKVSGARVNNLKNVTCRFPHQKLTVVTGPSGSGKSSLAFDTLYAEGQRRYVESMSAYARQFLERIEKPDVESIQNILPAIALEQKNSVKNARSTVGTSTEIYDYLRILYGTLGATRCDECGETVTKANPAFIETQLRAYPEGSKLLLLAPVPLQLQSIEQLLEKGYFRHLNADGEVRELTADRDTLTKHDVVQVVVDRILLRQKDLDNKTGGGTRFAESIHNGLMLGEGTLGIHDLSTGETRHFKSEYACPSCQKVFTPPFPNMFSFNNPLGACPTCEGFGRVIGLDMEKVIPNKSLSLDEGAIHPFTTPANQEYYDALLYEAKKYGIRLDVPYEELNNKEKAFVIDGKNSYPGVRRFFEWLESKKYKVHVRVMLAKYRGYYDCPDCLGSRIRKEALNVFIGDKTIWELGNMPVRELLGFFQSLSWSQLEKQMAGRLLREITSRLEYLNNVGLTYLTLARQSRTLSGGEAQRINLSAALGSALTDTLYVLDEPTVGLHARDTHRLLQVLKALRDLGNTLVIVEHDPEMILGADHLVDMGPGGGEEGGRIVYEGDLGGLLATPYSLTARYLNNRPLDQGSPGKQQSLMSQGNSKGQWIEIIGARGNNLQNVSVKIPTNQLVCVTGVSGSGKSTLIKQTLFAGYQRDKGEGLQLEMGPFRELKGLEGFKDVIMVDQSPPGRSQRSNPVTYVKAYDEIRALFADSRKAMVLGITAGHFSFNTPGGRCETCEGLGTVTVDMQFMADVTVVCSDCKGQRFNANVLSVDLFGRNINDVLNMTIDEAMKFFKTAPKVKKKLEPLHEMGLGYLKLGQSTSTLSGGEAQRLKLASYLTSGRKEGQPYLFLFDEPTTGLHMSDIDRLVQVFRRLLEAGHSIIVIEHNLEFIAQCDHLIDLGPEGGSEGGRILVEGTVKDIMACPESYTGQFLKLAQQSLPAPDSEPSLETEPGKPAKKTAAKASKKQKTSSSGARK